MVYLGGRLEQVRVGVRIDFEIDLLFRTSELESYWMEKVINMTESNDFKYIVWEESFSNGAPLTKNAVVQVWKDWTGFHPPSTIRSAIQRGFKALLSAPWYFDWPERGFVN